MEETEENTIPYKVETRAARNAARNMKYIEEAIKSNEEEKQNVLIDNVRLKSWNVMEVLDLDTIVEDNNNATTDMDIPDNTNNDASYPQHQQTSSSSIITTSQSKQFQDMSMDEEWIEVVGKN